MLGGHSTLNTVVLGEGVSKYRVPPLFILRPSVSNHPENLKHPNRVVNIIILPLRQGVSNIGG